MDLHERIAAIARDFSGVLGVAATNLTTGSRYLFGADRSFYPASTIKLPILYEVYRGAVEGRWDLEQKLTLCSENLVEGSGVLLNLTPGLELTVKDTAMLMITVSDNTATNMLVDLCTPEAVTRSMRELGLQTITLNRKIGMNVQIPLGEASPREMAWLMEAIANRTVLTPDACTGMIDILKRQQYKHLTSRFIPETDSEEDTPLVRVASKSGWVRGVRNEVALMWAPRATYVLAMYSGDCKDRRFYHDNEADVALARISQAVYEAWG